MKYACHFLNAFMEGERKCERGFVSPLLKEMAADP